jgi:hypothetical protein
MMMSSRPEVSFWPDESTSPQKLWMVLCIHRYTCICN